MSSGDLLAKREKIERQILALERTLGSETNSIELSSDSCASEDGSDDNESQPEHLGPSENLEAERQRIQKEIEELERTLGPDEDDQGGATESSDEDSVGELDLPQNTETCLQMNLVYQEVLKEKLEELERLLNDNRQQQNEIMTRLSSTGTPQATTSGQPTLKLFLGNFLKPYFKDKVTCLGPPANPEAKDIMSKRIRRLDDVKMKRWEGWQKTLLVNAVVKDSMKRMIQPKMSKVEYLTQKMTKAENMERQILRKQITEIEKEIENISALKENELWGDRRDDHDWQKISNIDFEGIREADDIKSFWQNYLHPSINKASWKENEIQMLKKVAQKHGHRNWDQIAHELGTNRTAFMCLQTYQRYICSDFRRSAWNSEEDEILRELVEKMRIGNYIPYTQISYFMEGRDSCQLMYRWTQVLDPTLKKGYWSKQEDEMLLKAVAKYGVGNWWKIRQEVPSRNDGQCRDRYLDVLIGNVKKGPFDEEEKALLRRLVEKYGYKWSKIAAEIPNRIDSQVLNQWRKMTGYKRCRSRRVRRSRPMPKKAASRQKSSDELDSSSDEEDVNMEFMDSDNEENRILPELHGSDKESDIIEDYHQPDMEQWIPMPDKMFEGPGKLRTMMVQRPSRDQSPAEQEQAATDSLSARQFLGVRSTILDRFGKVVATIIGENPRILAKKDYNSDLAMLKVCYGEVRNLIQWKKTNAAKQKTGPVSDDQAKPHSPSRQNNSSANSEHYTTFNYALQLAVVPWVGNVLIPPPLPSKKIREADTVRERAERVGLTNTPVFLLFLQVLRVDAEGCKQIIKMRNEQAMECKNGEPKLALNKQKQQYNLKTVAGILRQKEKEQEIRRQHGFRQPNSQLVMIPQTLVVAQPVVLSTPHPVVPSTPTSKQKHISTPSQPVPSTPGLPVPSTPGLPVPSTPGLPVPSTPGLPVPSTPGQPVPSTPGQPVPSTPGQPVPSTPGQPVPSTPGQPVPSTLTKKRNRLPTDNTQALKEANDPATKKAVKESPKCKRARMQSPPKVTLMSQPSNRVLSTTQNAWVLTPNGLVSISGISVQMAPQNVPTAVYAQPIIMNQQGSLTLNAPPSLTGTSFINGAAPRMNGPLNSLRMTNPGMRTVAANGPRVNVLSVPMNTAMSDPLQPQTGPSQAVVLKVPPGSLSASVPHRALRIVPLNAATHAPKPCRKPEAIQFDPHLMFMEDPAQVRKWSSGSNGVSLPGLKVTLPYLPPFVSNLTTLSGLLKCKTVLAVSAKLVLSPEEKENLEEEEQIAVVRSIVAKRFSQNPGYLLLKARFLSCFTMPALLATIDTVKESASLDSSDVEEEPLSNHSEQQDTVHDQPTALAPLLITDGMGAPAAAFSGIKTRNKCHHLNTDTEENVIVLD
ncbi:snRNA-activating protein complex subunit 4 [Esox lucius]|uniref:snRNA-activating protein complex subunit 4 n=1 Tax=Esox lucius TaxID=8010 RepID=UPI0010BDEA54|nr:snRNA-activating protein complex subunit 4 [Esox lucius]XP_028980487.1 snRNA-activating protein complex subunit 4 [Esox lucius]XP_034152352.1 snRNA-activating protein complex subunit 4 [Esox lucius]